AVCRTSTDRVRWPRLWSGVAAWGLGSPAGGHAFFQDAVVLDDLDAGGFGRGCGFVVTDSFLEPETGNPEADDVSDDCGNVFGGAEDVDEIDVRMGGDGGVEVGVGFFAKGRFY